MFKSLRQKIEARKQQEQAKRKMDKLQKDALEKSRGYNIKVNLKDFDPEKAVKGNGKVAVEMVNKSNHQKAVVEFDGKYDSWGSHDIYTPDSAGYINALNVGISFDGYKEKRFGTSNFSKGVSLGNKINSFPLPEEPYDVIVQMAANAAVSEIRPKEQEYIRQQEEDREKRMTESREKIQSEKDAENKLISDFLNTGR